MFTHFYINFDFLKYCIKGLLVLITVLIGTPYIWPLCQVCQLYYWLCFPNEFSEALALFAIAFHHIPPEGRNKFKKNRMVEKILMIRGIKN